MQHKKAEFTFQGLLVGLLFIGLFFGLIVAIMASLGGNYDTTGYDASSLDNFTVLSDSNSLKSDIEENYNEADKVTSDPGWFDFFSGIFSKILTPFKFTYRSFQTVREMVTYGSKELKLYDVFIDFFATLLTVLVLSLLLYRYFMGRK